jgi:hypothetical protein
MIFNFVIRGRLGNAIFRYMACVILCLYYDGEYSINNNQNQNCNDELFTEIVNSIIHKKNKINITSDLNMIAYYQQDEIYKLNKESIINFIIKNPSHYVLTDGFMAGDCNYEKFYMVDIINTPIAFNKKYKNVLHLRLEDFVTCNLYLEKERITDLLDKNIISDELCIVCKKLNTEFEFNYIDYIIDYLKNNDIKFFIEHNDVLTDFYIMKEAELLICSNSTLSWCAAFFSKNIKKCFFPNSKSINKYPIDNTELY